MRRKFNLLICMLSMVFVLFSQAGISYALDSANTGNSEEGSSYYFIHYNGEEQKIVVNENVTLTLTGWTDESKSSVKGKLDLHTISSNQTEDITMNVTDKLEELVVNDNESIHYRIVVSDSFKVEEVKPLELKSQVSVVAKNDNGTSIEEVKTIDEYGTVIENQGLTYYSTDKDRKIVISKDDYYSLNPVSVSPVAAKSSMSTSTVSGTQVPAENPSVNYTTHVQDIGWQNPVSDGEMSGTEGQAKRLESIKISISNVQDLGVKYASHVQDIGWLDYVSDGKESGTTGQSKRLEAIKIELTGPKAVNYDIYYRVHAQDYGWLGWAKNGESAGTEGLSKRLEAIEIVLVEKGGTAPGSTDKPFLTKPSVVYSTHVQDYGWLDFVADEAMSGTEGKAKRLEAIKIDLKNDAPYSGGITYSTHVQDYGWVKDVSRGEVSGTSGQSKRLEAIKINLTGDIANYYDIYYRVHIQDSGWLGWAKNGMKAGSEGLSKRLEAIEIKIVPKGQGESAIQKAAFKQPFTVFLDPGHGGSDPGAISGIYNEADLNLAVAKKVQSLLVNRGYTVYMSRTNDTAVENLDRAKTANNLEADIYVSIHTNATNEKTTAANGIEDYYYEYDPRYPTKINAAMHLDPVRISKSVSLANLIQESLVDSTGAVDRGTDGASWEVIREAAIPATLIEMGFINNPSERQKLFTDSYQNILAKAIAGGIDEYFGFY